MILKIKEQNKEVEVVYYRDIKPLQIMIEKTSINKRHRVGGFFESLFTPTQCVELDEEYWILYIGETDRNPIRILLCTLEDAEKLADDISKKYLYFENKVYIYDTETEMGSLGIKKYI